MESERLLVEKKKGRMCLFCNVNTEQIVLLQSNLHHPVVQTQSHKCDTLKTTDACRGKRNGCSVGMKLVDSIIAMELAQNWARPDQSAKTVHVSEVYEHDDSKKSTAIIRL